jgi:hypothetical protein
VDDDGDSGMEGVAMAVDRLTDGTRDNDSDKVDRAFPMDMVAGDERPLENSGGSML